MEQVKDVAPTLLPWFSLVVPIVAAAVTGYFSYRLGSRKEAGSTQAALHAGFRILIDDLQTERNHLSERLTKAIDEGNIGLNKEIQERLDLIEAKIEHNRRNADYNFQIINEVLAGQIDKETKRRARIVPQRLDPPPKGR